MVLEQKIEMTWTPSQLTTKSSSF